jgi:methionyl-tRNA formyltransferase
MRKSERVLFIGSKNLGLECLKAMHELSKETLIGVLTFDDRKDIRSVFEEMNKFCTQNNIPIFIAINRADSEKLIMELQPDICFVVGWYWLINDQTLSSVPKGFLGIHNSLLPKYRGTSPMIWSIMNGDEHVGSSMFTLSDKMDEGDIWFQLKIALNDDDDVGSILSKIEKGAVDKLRSHYLSILSGELSAQKQEAQGATYCSPRIPDDGKINWDQPARQVFNFIRAQSKPYPGAYTIHKNRKLIIWKAKLNPEVYYGTPGQVSRITSEGVTVVCGDSRSITLTDVEFEGKEAKANEIIKTIQTRFRKSEFLISDIEKMFEAPEIRSKFEHFTGGSDSKDH